MKKILLLMMLSPCFIMAQKGFSIEGNLKGLKDSTLVFLTDAQGNTIAQDYAANGKFTLSGKVEDATYNNINFINYQDKQMEVFVSNNKIKVEGDINNLAKATLSGSSIQQDFNSYLTIFNPLKEKFGMLYAKINAEKKQAKKDSLTNVFNTLKSRVIEQADNFIKSKPASPVSAFVLYVINGIYNNPEAITTRYNMLGATAKKTAYGQLLEKMINEANIGAEGTMAVDFSQNDTANVPVSLSSFKGKYVLVDFWASWCRPCRAENPNVVKAFNTFKNKNFTVLGVSFDQQKENWLQAIKADNLSWTHISDLKGWSNSVGQLYKISSIPQNMLLDPSGKIIGRNLRGEELISKLQQLIP